MSIPLERDITDVLDQALGYLNFSSGAPDPQFLTNLNLLFKHAVEQEQPLAWESIQQLLATRLTHLCSESTTFQEAVQVQALVETLVGDCLEAYLNFHRDLLFHLTLNDLANPFFIGRVCEALLAQGGPWEESDRVIRGAIRQLNDFIGYRPVATLETQKIEPYEHERLRPIPLYVKGAGVAIGAHQEVVEIAIDLLSTTDEDILRSANFDPQLLDELSIDPRAYDFDHPVNKRPNYHFGLWDPHEIDGQGRYRRFVVQQVTLDALMSRIGDPDLPHEEVVFEAAAVLAGTVLMASGICGWGPGAFNSTISLSDLLPQIASYRDGFYERLFSRVDGTHAARLRQESQERRQPFGGARQHLNAQLARRRATQLEHVQLAKLFARMGFPEAAVKQAEVVPAASARILCGVDCKISTGNRLIDRDDVQGASNVASQLIDLLQRGIECGAIIDPWNIIGFDANFSLFPALENSVRDHRADELVMLMEQIFAFYSRVWSEAAARNQNEVCDRIRAEFQNTSTWWRKYAVHEVGSVDAVDADDAFRAAEHVATALHVWHQGGAAAGDVAFWSQHADMFETPKGYALVIDALLQRGDFVAAMALLVNWLAQGTPLEQGESSFHRLAEMWLFKVQQQALECDNHELAIKAWDQIRKFLDYLEANAEDYWKAPQFELGQQHKKRSAEDPFGEEEEAGGDELFGAAYEDMVYRDSTDDGVEGPIFESGAGTDTDLEKESRRVARRLNFLSSMARLWRMAAVVPPALAVFGADPEQQRREAQAMRHWATQAATNDRQLRELIDEVQAHQIPAPSGDHDSLVEYDRHRSLKESLVDRVINTAVDLADAHRLLSAAAKACDSDQELGQHYRDQPVDQQLAMEVFAALLRGDTAEVRDRWADLGDALGGEPLLYVPLSKGGDPHDIVEARVRQQTVQDLLVWLPRQGLFLETCELIETAREMERDNPDGPGAVTEFDELFKMGYKSLVSCLVDSAASWKGPGKKTPQKKLVQCLETLTESLLFNWLQHSRTLRLSVLERVKNDRKDDWNRLVEFIKRYGGDIFTQRFFNFGNLRAILHQGVDSWLSQIEMYGGPEQDFLLFQELDSKLPREEAVEHLSLILEAIVENYGEYRDYNSTTTQSDRGEMLYMLLDFLRLRMKYDRMSWNLRPVVWTHEILVRRRMNEAAKLWRRTLAERIGEEADKYCERLATLQRKYAMRMPTIADRIGERFMHPLSIDRIRALVPPAMEEAKQDGEHPRFDLLEYDTAALTAEPTGVGLDMPAWLAALEDEVDAVLHPEVDPRETPDSVIPLASITSEEFHRQIDAWKDENS